MWEGVCVGYMQTTPSWYLCVCVCVCVCVLGKGGPGTNPLRDNCISVCVF